MVNQNLLPIYLKLYGEEFDYSQFDNRMNMQKAVYLLQTLGVPVGQYGFRWYLHGPYSQDLQDDMYAAAKVKNVPKEVLGQYKRRVDRLYQLIHAVNRGSYSISQWMECLASLHYLQDNVMDYDATMDDTLAELQRVKPKLNDDQANRRAYRELNWALRHQSVKGQRLGTGKLEFKGQILDNVHGFISYTKAEEQIMKTQLFRRLQGIKQLSVANWVFPGSEHTRFIHSLGVMHVADKIALTLGLSNRNRRILRLAGLLHDVGHYPLSHVCEVSYSKPLPPGDAEDEKTFCEKVNENVIARIENFEIDVKTDLMSPRVGMHHEAMGARIVLNDPEIQKIVIDELGSEGPQIIADIITGRVDRKGTDPLLVQIMHSELDADGIDYIMRDSASAGTNFGACEIDQLIRCMVVGTYKNKKILCIRPKGIPAADQYLINKFFHYSQVIFNRHITISEWMAEQVAYWMQQHDVYFPSEDELYDWSDQGVGEPYLAFNDTLFWSALDHLRKNELPPVKPGAVNELTEVPAYIRRFSEYLVRHDEPDPAKDHEIRIISDSEEEIRTRLADAEICTHKDKRSRWITALCKRTMSSQIPEKQFEALLNDPNSDAKSAEDMELKRIARMMECITVRDYDHKVHVLCDDERSLMRKMYRDTVVILRSYKYFPDPPAE